MKDKRVVFMGTPLYSVPVLKMLIEECNVVGVVTQPDKLVGRKKVLTPCPVKEEAIRNNIPVLCPVSLKDEYKSIFDFEPDIIVTCAYGQILPEELIYYPKYDTVNVHASILPKYRGGAPIHRALLNGDSEIGVTIMYTDKGMDSGDMICSRAISVSLDDTYDIVNDKMSLLGASLLKEVLPSIFDGTCSRVKQDLSLVSFAPVIKREDEHIDFSLSSLEVHNKIRAFSSVPGTYAILDDASVKIFLSSLEDCSDSTCSYGVITRCSRDGIFVACGDKEIKIIKLQFAGKKPVFVRDYLNGVSAESLIGKKFN